MSKKKKSHKKHQFKYAEPKLSIPSTEESSIGFPVQAAKSLSKSASLGYSVANLRLIKSDVRKVLILAGSFVLVELVLWFIFGHSGLGPNIYHLIKV